MKQERFNMKHGKKSEKAGNISRGVESEGMFQYETEPCDRCGFPTYKLMCKEVCGNCGGRRDCSEV